MSSGVPFIKIDLGNLSKPVNTLIERISDAIGVLYEPRHIRLIAQAEADADKIRAVGRIEVTDLERRALQRLIHEEAQKQENIENITRLALPEVSNDAKPEDIQKDW